jgi:hypothetical protein
LVKKANSFLEKVRSSFVSPLVSMGTQPWLTGEGGALGGEPARVLKLEAEVHRVSDTIVEGVRARAREKEGNVSSVM